MVFVVTGGGMNSGRNLRVTSFKSYSSQQLEMLIGLYDHFYRSFEQCILPPYIKSLQTNGGVGQKLWREHYQLYYFAIVQIYAWSSKDLPTVTTLLLALQHLYTY